MDDKYYKVFFILLCILLLFDIYFLCTGGKRNYETGAGSVPYHSGQLGNIQQKQDTVIREAKDTNKQIRDTTRQLSEIEQSDGARIAELKRILQGVQQRMQTETPKG